MSSGNSESCLIPVVVRGLRVLLVDKDYSALVYIASVLEEQLYRVKATNLASVALSVIQDGQDEFDLVMADTDLPEMDIFTFLNHVLVMSDLPVIFMSAVENIGMARKALSEGACFFLQKPIHRQDIINVWQHVYRKRTISRKIESHKAAIGKEVPEKDICGWEITGGDSLCRNVKRHDFLGMGSENISTDGEGKSRVAVESGFGQVWGNQDREWPRKAQIRDVQMGNQGGSHSRKRGSGDIYGGRSEEEKSDSKGVESMDDDSEAKDSDDDSSISPEKRSRMKWTPSLHLKFMDAVSSMGDGKVHPRTVLKRMNEPSLSVRHVASHLQKYRDRVNKINSATDSHVSEHNMLVMPYNFYSANGYIPGVLDGHNPTMQTQAVFNYPHSQIGAATQHFSSGESSFGHNHYLSLQGHSHDSPPLGSGVPLYQKEATPPNSNTLVHYTLKTLRKALKSAHQTGKRNSLPCVYDMSSVPVQAANQREPIYGSKGPSATGPNDTNLISNVYTQGQVSKRSERRFLSRGRCQNYDYENQQLLGFDWSNHNFTHLSPGSGCFGDWTNMYESVDMLPDVAQQVLDPFDQDLNPSPQNNLQNPYQLAAQGTSYFEGQGSNSSSVPYLGSFAYDQELNHPNPGSFSYMLNLVEGDQGSVKRELNRQQEIGEDEIDRYLDWFGNPDSANDFPQ